MKKAKLNEYLTKADILLRYAIKLNGTNEAFEFDVWEAIHRGDGGESGSIRLQSINGTAKSQDSEKRFDVNYSFDYLDQYDADFYNELTKFINK